MSEIGIDLGSKTTIVIGNDLEGKRSALFDNVDRKLSLMEIEGDLEDQKKVQIGIKLGGEKVVEIGAKLDDQVMNIGIGVEGKKTEDMMEIETEFDFLNTVEIGIIMDGENLLDIGAHLGDDKLMTIELDQEPKNMMEVEY